jgi:hypothetical protein
MKRCKFLIKGLLSIFDFGFDPFGQSRPKKLFEDNELDENKIMESVSVEESWKQVGNLFREALNQFESEIKQ